MYKFQEILNQLKFRQNHLKEENGNNYYYLFSIITILCIIGTAKLVNKKKIVPIYVSLQFSSASIIIFFIKSLFNFRVRATETETYTR